MIYTVGHSTRSLEEFVEILQAHHIAQLADIRKVPRSRRHPHFSGEALATTPPMRQMAYRHFAALGGLRSPQKDSVNTAWRNASFRGYADYMQTALFDQSVAELLEFASAGCTAVMCAEAVWWRCHRMLLADALVARGIPVWHLLSARERRPHGLTSFAQVEGERVIYGGLL